MAVNPSSVVECIKSPSPTLGFLFQDSPIKASAILALLITDLIKFLNVGKTMNDAQVAATIKLVLEDFNFRCLKPDDYKLCFNRMKTGYYGKSYDRIDGQVIFEALNQYLHERITEAEQISHQAHQMHTALEVFDKNVPANPEGQKKVVAILKAVLKEVPAITKKEVEAEGQKKPKIEKSPRDKFIQSCFDEFYKIWLKNPYKAPKKPALKIAGIVENDSIPGKFIAWPGLDIVVKEKRISKTQVEETFIRTGDPVDEVTFCQLKVKEYDQLIRDNKELEV